MNNKYDLEHLASKILLAVLLYFSNIVWAQTSEYPSFYTDNINSIPDLTQSDEKANFPGGGTEYCCLVAISNSLIWLGSNGFPGLVENSESQFDDEVKLVKLLGSNAYMNTSLDEGTGTTNIIRGLKKYIQDRGYEINQLEYQGWRKHPEEINVRYPVPQLDSIKQGILDKGSVWLNVGWYKYNPSENKYERIAGHWVTLVGYGKDANDQIDSNILILHDPSPRAGNNFSNEYSNAERINRGSLTGEWTGLPRSAAGYYKLGGGMHIKKGADTAIIDGVLKLQLKPKIGNNEIKSSSEDAKKTIKISDKKYSDGQTDKKLANARVMLKGSNKNTDEARKILLDLAENSASLTPVQCCYVYVYLGYIEDLAENRDGAAGWFKKACKLEAARQDGIYKLAEQGLSKPVTFIRHLDGETTKSGNSSGKSAGKNKGRVQRIGKGIILKDEPKDAGVPKMNLSKIERLENFDILAEAIDKNYSFFIHKNIDWPSITAKYRQKIEKAETTEEFYLLIHKFVRELKDAHSWLCNYRDNIPALQEFSPQIHTRLIDGKLIVTEVFKNSEAYKNGLRPGAVITGINGLSVTQMVEKIRPLMRMYSSERGFQEQAYRQVLNGQKDSIVNIRFIAQGENLPKIAKLKRVYAGIEKIIELNFPVNKNKYIWDGVHPSGYGYIGILSFLGREDIADEFDLALERLKNTPGLIIDIRDNPGGFGTAQPRIIGRLITARTKVDISYTKNSPEHGDFTKNETYFEPTGNWQYTKPIVLLTNAVTGSASDLFACRLISTGRPITIGTSTHGNSTGGGVYVLLPCNLVVRVSAGYICDVSGKIIEVNGNTPKIHAETTLADILNGTDSIMERAVRELKLQRKNGNSSRNSR